MQCCNCDEDKPKLFDVGNYTCSKSEDIQKISKAHEFFKLNNNVTKLLKKKYKKGFGFFVCLLKKNVNHSIHNNCTMCSFVTYSVLGGNIFFKTWFQKFSGFTKMQLVFKKRNCTAVK